MATTLSATVAASISWTYESVLAWANAVNSHAYSYAATLDDGTGADQADRIYIAQGTIAASTTLNLDLAASLTDIFGSSITMARVKAIYVELTEDTSSSGLLVGGHATTAFGTFFDTATDLDTDQPAVVVRNGGCFLLSAPDATAYVVTATTEDILSLTNADGVNIATYRIVLVGASA